MKAVVTGDFGRDYLAETADGAQYICSRKGKKQDVTCGDEVEISVVGRDPSEKTGRIDEVKPRRNVLFRSDQWKEKTLAANIDQVIIIIAPRPSFSETFLSMCLLACEAARIPVLIMLNKQDLPEIEAARTQLKPYEAIGYQVLPMAAKFDIEPLRPHLEGKVTLLVGQSGMGKSRTVNQLVMRDVAREAAFSEALDSGKHTTTYTRLYWLGGGSGIIDSPGLQSFGLFHLADDDIAWAMPEFRRHIGSCKFSNCVHLSEPGCAVIDAASTGEIAPSRLAFYQALIEQQQELRGAHPSWKR